MVTEVSIITPEQRTARLFYLLRCSVYGFVYLWLWFTLQDYHYFESLISYYFGAFYYYTLIFPVELVKHIYFYVGNFMHSRSTGVFVTNIVAGLSALFYISFLLETLKFTLQSKYRMIFMCFITIPGLCWLAVGSLDWLLYKIFRFDINDVLYRLVDFLAMA